MQKSTQVVLLRVGIDSGSGGIQGPIFGDDTFEFIPIDSVRGDRLGRTYGNTAGRHGRKMIEYFSGAHKERMRNAFLHFDPEFETYTYGDPTRPKQCLKRLSHGDWLVFYAGLEGWGGCQTPPGLYVIGYFVIEEAGFYFDLRRKGVISKFRKNWHILNDDDRKKDLVLIKGGLGSRLLKKTVKISADKKATDRGGHPVFVLDPNMSRYFGTFTEMNAIQRSTPRWVKPKFCNKAVTFLKTLT
jgi:hypothetical protein